MCVCVYVYAVPIFPLNIACANCIQWVNSGCLCFIGLLLMPCIRCYTMNWRVHCGGERWESDFIHTLTVSAVCRCAVCSLSIQNHFSTVTAHTPYNLRSMWVALNSIKHEFTLFHLHSTCCWRNWMKCGCVVDCLAFNFQSVCKLFTRNLVVLRHYYFILFKIVFFPYLLHYSLWMTKLENRRL